LRVFENPHTRESKECMPTLSGNNPLWRLSKDVRLILNDRGATPAELQTIADLARRDSAARYGEMELVSVVSQKYFIKIGTTKEDRKSKLVIPRPVRRAHGPERSRRVDRGIQ
jgi:hypothetical protein